MNILRKKIIIPIALIFSLVIILAVYNRTRQYTTVKPQRGNITEAIYGLGKVKSSQRYEVKIGVVSTIKKLYVREGDAVKPQDKLIDLDSSGSFRAPFAGIVTAINFFEGETALPHTPIIRVENLQKRYIEVSLEQEGAMRTKKGQNVKVSFENLRGKNLQGRVLAIFPKDNEFLAHIEVDNLDSSILPGMTADTSIEVAHIENALLIPLNSITNGLVTVLREGKKTKLKVDIGHIDGLMAEVRDNTILADDLIILKSEK